MNQNFIWYSFKLILFLVPIDSPASLQSFTKTITVDIGVTGSITHTEFLVGFNVSDTFKGGCYYDSAKTAQDKIHLVPSLAQISIVNPHYVNLTSTNNWEYDWDTTTTLLQFLANITTTAKVHAYFMIFNIMGFCPNSYMFTAKNFTISASPNNWFVIEANTYNQNKTQIIDLTTPISGDSAVLIGLSLTGYSLFDDSFSELFVSANLTYYNDVMNQPTGYLGTLSYYSLMPSVCYVNYWAMGLIGNCPTNFAIFNATHCYCNPAQNLTYDLAYSNYKCRQICPLGYYFSYAVSMCISCQSTYSFLCSTCNSTTCFNCTNGLQYYLKGATVLCLDCITLFG